MVKRKREDVISVSAGLHDTKKRPSIVQSKGLKSGEDPKSNKEPSSRKEHTVSEEDSDGRGDEEINETDGSDEDEDEDEEDSPEVNHNEDEKTKTKAHRKQISAQEVQDATRAAEVFKSGIFKLQIDELLKEVKLKELHVAKIEEVLHRLHDLIQKIPEIEDLSLSQAENHFNSKKIVIPFPDPKPTKVNYTFSYLKPQEVKLIGSFGLKTGINSPNGMSIDMALIMPSKLFQAKDYLNYRALYKRAFYLSYLAENLIQLTKKNNLPIKITYEFLNDDILCPSLRIDSINTNNADDLIFNKTKFSIQLIAGFPFGIFDSKKLLPHKNCIRVQIPENHQTQELPPTPLYNSSILSSTTYEYYLKYLYTSKKVADSFKEACILGRLWLSQRGFGSNFNNGGFGHFEFAMLMSALLHGDQLARNGILHTDLSSYQLFKATIKYLASQDLSKGYLAFSSAIGEMQPTYNETGFDVPTIFDKNTKINILWKMTNSSYRSLKNRASETLDLLNDVVRDRFDPILLKNRNFDHLKYDIVLNLTIPEEMFENFGPLEKISFINFENFVKNKLYRILDKALGDRAFDISIQSKKVLNIFSINKRKPTSFSNQFIIGLNLNPDECEKLVTKGPNSEDSELGMKFRSFWGSKSSLRRFKDGTIQHSVVWESDSTEPVVLPIIRYVLDSHLHSDISQHLETSITKFNKLLPIPLLPAASKQSVTSLTSFQALKVSCDGLIKVLSNFELPLSIKSILPISPSLRYTSLLQPVPFAVSSPDFWNELILQFETSTRWPDELIALERTKTAFLLKILEHVNKETIYKAFLTKDNTIPLNDDISLLNILTPEGYGFKIRVLTERDELLYLRAANNAEKQKPLLQDIYIKFNQKYIASIKHHRVLTSMVHHCQYYSPTVRLFKKWLDSQLLLTHFNDELVELIALKPFVDPAPYSIPCSIESGFLQILKFISEWNWKDDALILDLTKREGFNNDNSNDLLSKLSDKLNVKSYQIIQSNFEKIRKSDPTSIKTQLFVGSKYDPSGIMWSNGLTLPIASRLTALSRVALNLLQEQGLSETNIDLLFTPSLNDFDFAINLKTMNLTSSSGILPSNTFKNLLSNTSSYPEDVCSKYDHIQCLYSELVDKYGNIILFSTKKYTGLNENGENVITGLFIPYVLGKKKFKVNLGFDMKPLEMDDVIINKESIFSQITTLGGDLVKTIEVKK